MKGKSKKTAGVFLLAVILAFVFCTDVAVLASEKRGSITVELNEIGTDRKNVALECFQTAEKKGTDWKLTEAFAGSMVKPWELSKSADYKVAAEKLSSWATAKKLSSGSEMTDQNGKLVFADLREGIYLVRQKSGQKTYGVIAPFLVCIPMEENGQFLYDVCTETKGENIKQVSPTPSVSAPPVSHSDTSGKTPSTKNSSSRTANVKTGDDTSPAGFWLLLAVASGGVAGVLYYRKKH